MYEPHPDGLQAPLRVTLAPDPVERDAGPLAAPPLHVDDILRRVVELGGSDLHLAAGRHPTIRLRGEIGLGTTRDQGDRDDPGAHARHHT